MITNKREIEEITLDDEDDDDLIPSGSANGNYGNGREEMDTHSYQRAPLQQRPVQMIRRVDHRILVQKPAEAGNQSHSVMEPPDRVMTLRDKKMMMSPLFDVPSTSTTGKRLPVYAQRSLAATVAPAPSSSSSSWNMMVNEYRSTVSDRSFLGDRYTNGGRLQSDTLGARGSMVNNEYAQSPHRILLRNENAQARPGPSRDTPIAPRLGYTVRPANSAATYAGRQFHPTNGTSSTSVAGGPEQKRFVRMKDGTLHSFRVPTRVEIEPNAHRTELRPLKMRIVSAQQQQQQAAVSHSSQRRLVLPVQRAQPQALPHLLPKSPVTWDTLAGPPGAQGRFRETGEPIRTSSPMTTQPGPSSSSIAYTGSRIVQAKVPVLPLPRAAAANKYLPMPRPSTHNAGVANVRHVIKLHPDGAKTVTNAYQHRMVNGLPRPSMPRAVRLVPRRTEGEMMEAREDEQVRSARNIPNDYLNVRPQDRRSGFRFVPSSMAKKAAPFIVEKDPEAVHLHVDRFLLRKLKVEGPESCLVDPIYLEEDKDEDTTSPAPSSSTEVEIKCEGCNKHVTPETHAVHERNNGLYGKCEPVEPRYGCPGDGDGTVKCDVNVGSLEALCVHMREVHKTALKIKHKVFANMEDCRAYHYVFTQFGDFRIDTQRMACDTKGTVEHRLYNCVYNKEEYAQGISAGALEHPRTIVCTAFLHVAIANGRDITLTACNDHLHGDMLIGIPQNVAKRICHLGELIPEALIMRTIQSELPNLVEIHSPFFVRVQDMNLRDVRQVLARGNATVTSEKNFLKRNRGRLDIWQNVLRTLASAVAEEQAITHSESAVKKYAAPLNPHLLANLKDKWAESRQSLKRTHHKLLARNSPALCEELYKVVVDVRERIERNVEERFHEKVDYGELTVAKEEEEEVVDEEEEEEDEELFRNIKTEPEEEELWSDFDDLMCSPTGSCTPSEDEGEEEQGKENEQETEEKEEHSDDEKEEGEHDKKRVGKDDDDFDFEEAVAAAKKPVKRKLGKKVTPASKPKRKPGRPKKASQQIEEEHISGEPSSAVNEDKVTPDKATVTENKEDVAESSTKATRKRKRQTKSDQMESTDQPETRTSNRPKRQCKKNSMFTDDFVQ